MSATSSLQRRVSPAVLTSGRGATWGTAAAAARVSVAGWDRSILLLTYYYFERFFQLFAVLVFQPNHKAPIHNG